MNYMFSTSFVWLISLIFLRIEIIVVHSVEENLVECPGLFWHWLSGTRSRFGSSLKVRTNEGLGYGGFLVYLK